MSRLQIRQKSPPNKNAKGNPNTRTITWKHRNKAKKLPATVLESWVDKFCQDFELSRDRWVQVFSNVEEPFIPFELIRDVFEKIPEQYDHIFQEECPLFDRDGLTVLVYHTKDNKHEDFPFDAFSRNGNGLICITDASFYVEENGCFGMDKSSCTEKPSKWNSDIFTHFFGDKIVSKEHYDWKYTKEGHYNYITQFLLLHEFGHKVVYKKDIDEIGKEQRYLNYEYLKEEAKANEVVMKLNPALKNIFEVDIKEILYD